MSDKEIIDIKRATEEHWVGDGFPVNSILSYYQHGASISPFLLLDYAGPANFKPSKSRRGVGQHPHRGFETVTIIYDGEVEHRDSVGNSGQIGSGDVQWMTAARGLVHEEMHSQRFTETGGQLEMIQLWVNLPAKHKMSNPGYQAIVAKDIPVVELNDHAGSMRLIAGDYGNICGAAKTFTPINLWDIKVNKGANVTLPIQEGHNVMLLVMSGGIEAGDGQPLKKKEIAHFSCEGNSVSFTALKESRLLLMGGEPIDEPIVGRGPFVMNTAEEIHTAMRDYSEGKF